MTATSDFAPVSSSWLLEVQARSSIQAIIERGFTLKCVSLIIKLAKLVIAVNSTPLLYVYKINNLESVVFSNLLILLLSLGSLDLANDGLKPLGTYLKTEAFGWVLVRTGRFIGSESLL